MKKTKHCAFCGAEIKISKKGNEYCSNFCWTKEPWKTERELEQIEIECKHENWGDR